MPPVRTRAAPPHPPPHPPPRRALAGLAFVVLVVSELGAVALLVSLGHRPPFDLAFDPRRWSAVAPLDALAATLRWVGLAVAAWLLLTTLASFAAAAATARPRPWSRALAPIGRLAPRAVRRLAQHALASGIVVGLTAAPAAAQREAGADAPIVTVVRDGRATDLASLPGTGPVPAPPVATPASPPNARQAAPVTAAAPDALLDAPTGTGRTVAVAPGEHLWELAAREVARRRGVPRELVSDDDVAPYWVVVCDANRDRLASGDVDVVQVGETVVLPPVS